MQKKKEYQPGLRVSRLEEHQWRLLAFALQINQPIGRIEHTKLVDLARLVDIVETLDNSYQAAISALGAPRIHDNSAPHLLLLFVLDSTACLPVADANSFVSPACSHSFLLSSLSDLAHEQIYIYNG